MTDFAAFCAEQKWPVYRARQVYEWVFHRGLTDFEAMSNLGKPLRVVLAEQWAILTATEIRRQESTDATVKLLFQWPDQATSECVLIPDANRRTVCISTQVGCAVGCAFCASGLGGLERNLTAGEIVEQVFRVRALCQVPAPDKSSEDGRLSNIVFMGIGEPLANYDNLMTAVRIINADWGMSVGARRITISTIGLPKQIRRLAGEDLQVNLAVSLHAPTDVLRRKLIPWAGKTSIAEVTGAAEYFFEKTGREVTLEYILIGGVNDQLTHADGLAALCRRIRCNVNLIRYNPVPGVDFERPTSAATHRFVEQLRSRGVNVHVRKSRGLDIDAACGQLRRAAGTAADKETPVDKRRAKRSKGTSIGDSDD
jgi:23S rRNA (adenine2503-C2)-methyltransferase